MTKFKNKNQKIASTIISRDDLKQIVGGIQLHKVNPPLSSCVAQCSNGIEVTCYHYYGDDGCTTNDN